MPLRNFFEGLGDFFDWTFGFLPAVGGLINILFILTMAGFGAYWFVQMKKSSRRGEQ